MLDLLDDIRFKTWGAIAAVVAFFWAVAGPIGGVPGAGSHVPPENWLTMQPQLVVYETESCGWCRAFREDIAPVYMRSKHASWATLRYVDLNDADDGKQFKLARGISALPTLVLVDTAGREVSRMSGHPGEPAKVYRFLDKNLARIAP